VRAPSVSEPEFVPAAVPASWFAVSVASWLRWSEIGDVPRPVTVGGKPRWSIAELYAWRDAGCPDRQTWEALKSAAVPA
jgi:hypothetical protein